MRRSLMFVVAVGALWTVATAQAQLISQPTALRYGLERAWYHQMSVDSTRSRLEKWILNNDLIIAHASSGLVTALDAETGAQRWTAQIGRAGVPTVSPAANSRYVAVASGEQLYVLDRPTGRTVWQRKMQTAINADVAISDERVFVALSNGWLASYKLEDPNDGDWHYASKGFPVMPPVVTQQSVVWANDRGLLHAAEFERNRLAFQFETDAPIAAPMGFLAPYLFLATTDENVYAINTRRGRRLGQAAWRFYVGGKINQQPVPLEDRVYVSTSDAGLYCIKIELASAEGDQPRKIAKGDAKEDEPEAKEPAAGPAGAPIPALRSGGVTMWWTPRATGFVSSSPTRVYTTDSRGRLMILDRETGGQLETMDVSNLPLKLINTLNDRIYLATNDGLLQCLRQRDLEKPVAHKIPGVDKEERRQIERGPAAKGDAEPKEEAKEDAAEK